MYALIHDYKIKVGPRNWSYFIFKNYLDKNKFSYEQLPFAKPKTAIITTDWSIFPVTNYYIPEYDTIFEQLSGPQLNIDFEKNIVTGSYSVVPVTIEMAKGKLKEKITQKRYEIEVQGCEYTFADNTVVGIYTNREDRGTYVNKYLLMDENETVMFKFKDSIFKSCTKSDMANIISVGSAWIQNAFSWEANLYTQIDNCNNLEELKLINLEY